MLSNAVHLKNSFLLGFIALGFITGCDYNNDNITDNNDELDKEISTQELVENKESLTSDNEVDQNNKIDSDPSLDRSNGFENNDTVFTKVSSNELSFNIVMEKRDTRSEASEGDFIYPYVYDLHIYSQNDFPITINKVLFNNGDNCQPLMYWDGVLNENEALTHVFTKECTADDIVKIDIDTDQGSLTYTNY